MTYKWQKVRNNNSTMPCHYKGDIFSCSLVNITTKKLISTSHYQTFLLGKIIIKTFILIK